MANEVGTRADFLAKSGTPYIDSSGDLCPGNVGGQIVAVPFVLTVTGGSTSGDGLLAGSTVTKFCPYKSGSIVGLSLYNDTAVTLGHVTATVFKGATTTGFATTLTTITGATTKNTASQVKDTDAFSAGDALSVHFDAAATNTAGTVLAMLFVEM